MEGYLKVKKEIWREAMIRSYTLLQNQHRKRIGEPLICNVTLSKEEKPFLLIFEDNEYFWIADHKYKD